MIRVGQRRRTHLALVLAAAISLCLLGTGLLLIGGGDAQTSDSTPTISQAPAPLVEKPFTAETALEPDTSTPPADLAPSSIAIPSVGILASFTPVGVQEEEMMLPSPDINQAGLLNVAAPITSDEGSTLISAHVNTNQNQPGTFGTLAKVRPGATVFTTDDSGARKAWQIRTLESYPQGDIPSKYGQPTGARQLVLVTCGGQPQGFSTLGMPIYTHNTVAVAFPVEVEK